MAYSFGLGAVDMSKIPLSMGQTYPVGDTRNLDVYDDGILRAARAAQKGRATTQARTATNTASDSRLIPTHNLTFGTSVGTTGVAPSTPLSFGSAVQSGTNALTNFLNNMTFGTPVGGGGASATGGGGSRGGGAVSGVSPIPQVVTADGDGSTGALSGLADLAKGIFASIGNSADGDVVPVAYPQSAPASGGFNPLWIAAAAVAAGAIYYAAAK